MQTANGTGGSERQHKTRHGLCQRLGTANDRPVGTEGCTYGFATRLPSYDTAANHDDDAGERRRRRLKRHGGGARARPARAWLG